MPRLAKCDLRSLWWRPQSLCPPLQLYLGGDKELLKLFRWSSVGSNSHLVENSLARVRRGRDYCRRGGGGCCNGPRIIKAASECSNPYIGSDRFHTPYLGPTCLCFITNSCCCFLNSTHYSVKSLFVCM